MFRTRLNFRSKTLFFSYGALNVLFTNILLQFLLLVIPTIYATLAGQIFNFLFGFYFYGKKVFKVNNLTKKHLLKYLLLNTLVWNLNWIIIEKLSSTGLSKNIASLIIIIPLGLFSYLLQKKLVFIART